jgi:putative pyruvate formate lyase activating enzyme
MIAEATRSELARARIAEARSLLTECHLCAQHCGTDRLNGQLGVCRAGSTARIFSAQIEVSDELELLPVFAIALSGCNIHCDFCITGKYSWNAESGEVFSLKTLAQQAEAALASGVRSIMILGGEPTIHLPTALEIIAALPEAKLIWKTNAFATPQARELLDGLFDVWVADYKFGNDACAKRLSQASDYTSVVRENLLWAGEHSELIVRHLLMPGHIDCCWQPVAEWLGNMQVKVNLRSGFWLGPRAGKHHELRKPLTPDELNRAQEIAARYHLRLIQ